MNPTVKTVLQFALRFVLGGTLVAIIPCVAQRWSAQVAGVVVLFPAVTLGGLTFLWLDQGTSSAETAAISGLYAVPAVAAYLLGLWLVLRWSGSYFLAITVGILAWLLVAILIVRLRGLT